MVRDERIELPGALEGPRERLGEHLLVREAMPTQGEPVEPSPTPFLRAYRARYTLKAYSESGEFVTLARNVLDQDWRVSAARIVGELPRAPIQRD